jgi:hypothetical protein
MFLNAGKQGKKRTADAVGRNLSPAGLRADFTTSFRQPPRPLAGRLPDPPSAQSTDFTFSYPASLASPPTAPLFSTARNPDGNVSLSSSPQTTSRPTSSHVEHFPGPFGIDPNQVLQSPPSLPTPPIPKAGESMSSAAASLWASLGNPNHGHHHLSSSYPLASHHPALTDRSQVHESKAQQRNGNGDLNQHQLSSGGSDPFLAALRGPHVFPPHFGQDSQPLHVSLNSLLQPGDGGGGVGASGGDAGMKSEGAGPGAASPTVCFNCKTSVSLRESPSVSFMDGPC